MNGTEAEDRALQHLQRHGLQALARNWRCRSGELDLVLRDGATLVIAEVRQRSSAAYGGALGSIDARKRERIVRATQSYLAEHPQHADAPLRFDVLALDGAGRIDWLKAAFDADD